MENVSEYNPTKNLLEERRKKVFDYLKKDKKWVIWSIFTLIAWFGYYIRTRNLSLLVDITTGKYIPADPDAFAFWRYAAYVLEHGELMNIDYMRYYPWGYDYLIEFKFLSHFIADLYNFLHFFNPSITIGYVDVLYPAIAFVFGLLFFFLLVNKLFNYRVALLATLLLTIIPPYLFRTMSGVSDKEALGMVFFFAALYFFVSGWKSKTLKKNLILGALAGLSTGLMGLVWGGFILLISIIGLFGLINFVLLKFRNKNLLAYGVWYVSFYLIMIIFRDYGFNSIVGAYYGATATITLFSGLFIYLANKYNLKKKIEDKTNLPYRIVVFAFIIILGIVFVSVLLGPSFIFDQIKQIYITLTNPFGTDRWQLTVAEAHQPYLIDLISNVSWKFFWMYVVGSILIIYYLLKPLDKNIRKYGLVIYILFIVGFNFSRYSQNSQTLNGVSFFSQIIVYFGGILLIIFSYLGYYLYSYYKNKDSFNKMSSIKGNHLFVLLWLLVLLVASRSAIRLIFIFSSIISLLAAYFCIKLFDLSLKQKKDYYKIGIWILLFLLLINPFVIANSFAYGLFNKGIILEHSQISLNQAKNIGPGYNQQWQIAGKWARENTPKDAVFSHWWDYGYFVQGGFERATITDGGNAKSSLNHFMGRSVLTGQNEIESLEFLKAHSATHLLIVSDEIGKYPAFSSIGADEKWDRYSWLQNFQLDSSKRQETRDYLVNIYTGVSPVDWDFEYNGELFSKGESVIIGFFIPIKNINGTNNIENPSAVVVNKGQQKQIPIECIFANGQQIKFDQTGLGGCLMFIPSINGDKINPSGAILYISEKVRKTNFARLYLFNELGGYFKLVYSDEDQIPLALYNGRIMGPLKIWEISYPDNLKIPEYYYKDELPNPNVKNLEGRY